MELRDQLLPLALIFVIIGTIVQSINGPNLVVPELVNNINIVQCATIQFNNIKCSAPIKLFIRRLLSSKRHAFPNQMVINGNMFIRLGRKLKLANDHLVMVHLHNTHIFNFNLYRTCWKNNVRFSVVEFSTTNKTCDSCVLYKDQYQTKCGFITAIVYDAKQECYAVLHKVNTDRQDSLMFKNKNVINPFIFWGHLTDPPQMLVVHFNDIIVKLAYSKQETFHFYRYPNVVEST
jgi:hypothetical protein